MQKTPPIMQNTQPGAAAERFDLLLFDGFSNLCLANAVEPLRAANMLSRRPLYAWRLLSIAGASATSSSGLSMQTRCFGDDPPGDALIVMPSYGHRRFDLPPVRRALRAAGRRYGVLAGLDTGSWLLAASGLLDGRRATIHWDLLSELAETFPEVDVVEDRFVVDGDRATCGGATTTLELTLDLIERRHGPALALEVAALFMFGERDPRPAPLRRLPPDHTVRAAAALMRRHLETPLSTAQIAQGVGKSLRSLEALFRARVGRGPFSLYRSIRLAEARRRLEQTDESMAEVAQRCGYADPSAMARAFKAEFGLSPSAARRGRAV